MEGNVEFAEEWYELRFCMASNGIVTALVDTWKGVSILKTVGMDFLNFGREVVRYSELLEFLLYEKKLDCIKWSLQSGSWDLVSVERKYVSTWMALVRLKSSTSINQSDSYALSS